MPSVRKVKRQFSCSGAPCGDPLKRCSSKCTRQPLVKNVGAITPPESKSLNASKPSCRPPPLLHPQPEHSSCEAAADTADTEGFSYSRTTTALLCLAGCLSVCLSLTRCNYLPPSLTLLQHVTCSLTSLTIGPVSCPDPIPLLPLLLSTIFYLSQMGQNRILSASFEFQPDGSH